MTISASDIRLRKSLRMTDNDDGGGRMGTGEVVDGVKNAVFDDLTDLQRIDGAVSYRKLFPALLSDDTAAYLSAHVIVDGQPADTSTTCWVAQYGGDATERAAAASAFVSSEAARVYAFPNGYSSSNTIYNNAQVEWDAGATSYRALVGGLVPNTSGGMSVFTDTAVSDVSYWVVPSDGSAAFWLRGNVAAKSLVSGKWVVPALTALPASAGSGQALMFGPGTQRLYSASALTAAAASGASTVKASTWVQAQLPGTGSVDYPNARGLTPAFVAGDRVVIRQHAIATGTVANGQTVNPGLTNCVRIRVIGNDKTVYAVFAKDQATIGGSGMTADLTAGTVSFSTVGGLSQPVTVEARAEELNKVKTAYHDEVTLLRPLSRAYPAGSVIASALVLGDLRARVPVQFAQLAWLSAWQDTAAGGSITAAFNSASYPIEVSNRGAVNERWALIFTSSTTYNIVGETLGVIGTGSVNADCAPTNPATSVPYWTVRIGAWGAGWALGNVLRFNTAGANAPIWVARTTLPSTSFGDDAVTLQVRGYSNS